MRQVLGYVSKNDKVYDKELYKKIEYVLSLSQERVESIRAYNKKLVEDRFDIKENFKRLDKKIRELV